MRREVLTAARKAVRVAGGPTALSRLAGVSQQVVQGWLKNGVPPKWVPRLAGALNLTYRDIRPDVFP